MAVFSLYLKHRKEVGSLKVEWISDPDQTEPHIVIHASEKTPELEALIRRLEESLPAPLLGFDGDRAVPLDLSSVLRFYGEEKGVFAQTPGDTFRVRERLYELEEVLDSRTFVRISQSEIVNLKQVTALDLAITGTIKMTLTGGTVCFVSRRYVKKIKEALGLGRRGKV